MRIPGRPAFLPARTNPGSELIPQAVQNYLLPYEHMAIVVRKHPGAYFGHCLIAGCWCVAASLITALTGGSVLILGTVWGVFAMLLAWLASRAVVWLCTYFVATNVRLIIITGLTTTKVVSIPLRKISALQGRRSLLSRIIGYGEFVAEPARPDYTVPRLKYMPYPEQLLVEIGSLLHPEESDD